MASLRDRQDRASFAQRLTHFRQEKGLTQAELARRTRELLIGTRTLDRASISRYEAGANKPRRDVLQALAKVLEVTTSDLMPPRVVVEPTKPSIDLQVVMALDGDGEMARVTINNLLVPFSVALEILEKVRPYHQAKAESVEKKES